MVSLRVHGQPLPEVDSYRYLGGVLHWAGSHGPLLGDLQSRLRSKTGQFLHWARAKQAHLDLLSITGRAELPPQDKRQRREITLACIIVQLRQWLWPYRKVALEENGLAIAFASEDLQADRELMETALRRTGEALELLEAFQADEEIVLWAVQTSGTCLRFAAEELRRDPDLCLEAVRQNWEAIEYCHPTLYSDWDFMKQAIGSSWRCLSFAHPDLCNDKEVVRIALRHLKSERALRLIVKRRKRT
ncbi:unnamed protein product [Durusdinium trenchii]|uniref:DUF4116 domain-containing protein n=1 Tax=Durusdinium trenchii TaxID=1381693 RepID=A0ABP0SX75_9DINO